MNGAKGKKLDTAIAASPLYADGKIYVCTLSGVWYTLKLNGNNVDVLYRMRLSGGEVNASPIVSHGRIYQQLANVLYCIGQTEQGAAGDTAAPTAKRDSGRQRHEAGSWPRSYPASRSSCRKERRNFRSGSTTRKANTCGWPIRTK